MATSEEIQKRRLEFATLMAHGSHVSHAVQLISEKFGISKRQLYSDWERRDTWGLDYTPDDSLLVEDTLFRLSELKRRLWQVADARDPFADAGVKDRLKALIALADIEHRGLQAAQSLGMVNREPVRIELEQTAEAINDRIVELCGDDAQLKERILSIFMDVAQNEN
jgi:hypothetical protein